MLFLLFQGSREEILNTVVSITFQNVPTCLYIIGALAIFHISGIEVIKLEFILRLKIKRNDWLLADTCPQADNHCALY